MDAIVINFLINLKTQKFKKPVSAVRITSH